MKKLIISILVFIPFYLSAQWEIINEGGKGYIKDVEFVSKSLGWIECDTELLKTNDGGENWISVFKNKTEDKRLIDAVFSNDSIGWLIFDGNLLKTTNGGLTWISQLAGKFRKLQSINDSTTIVQTDNDLIITLDGGNKWQNINLDGIILEGNSEAYFISPDIGYLLINSVVSSQVKTSLYSTENRGQAWNKVYAAGGHSKDLSFINRRKGYIIQSGTGSKVFDESLYTTVDSGNTWTKIHNDVYSYSIDSSGSIYICVNEFDSANSFFSGKILKSLDNGFTWNEIFCQNNLLIDFKVFNNKAYLMGGIAEYGRYSRTTSGIFLSTTDNLVNLNHWSNVQIRHPLQRICMTDKLNGFAAGSNFFLHGSYGNILKTNDGGINWEVILRKDRIIEDMHFINDTIAFYSSPNEIIKSNNIFNNASLIFNDSEYYILDIWFNDESNGWAVGDCQNNATQHGVIISTSDSGNSWNKDISLPFCRINSIFMINNELGWAVGEERSYGSTKGVLLKYDKFNGWEKQPYLKSLPFNKLFFANENIGYILGGYDTYELQKQSIFLRTVNGGDTWDEIDLSNYLIKDIFIDNYGVGWAIGLSYINNGVILRTEDFGLTWLVETDTLPSPLNALTVYDNLVIAVGENGLIVRTTNSGTTWVDSQGKAVVSKYNLTQNYPNPFNPNTTIKYTIPSETVMLSRQCRDQHLNDEIPGQALNEVPHVLLKVYDILGREITTLVNKNQKPGNYEIDWNAADSPSGVYFYKLESGIYKAVRKMILIK